MKSGVQLGGEPDFYTEKLIDFQALWLRRHAAISNPAARVMAQLHFGGAA